jgi:hypothetical protein
MSLFATSVGHAKRRLIRAAAFVDAVTGTACAPPGRSKIHVVSLVLMATLATRLGTIERAEYYRSVSAKRVYTTGHGLKMMRVNADAFSAEMVEF